MTVPAASSPFSSFPRGPYDKDRARLRLSSAPTVPLTLTGGGTLDLAPEPLTLTGGGTLDLGGGDVLELSPAGVLELAGGDVYAVVQFRPGEVA